MSEIRNFEIFFYNDLLICPDCSKNFKIHKQVYNIDGIPLYVLYEYDEFLCEHLYLKKIFKKYCVCTLCSSDAKRMERGFEPAIDMYSSLDVFVHSPFYKKKDIKQSSATKLQRSQIKNALGLKQLYPLPKKKILLVDDVCTTGSTLLAAKQLIHPDCMFVLAAHPLWILANQENIVVKSKGFW